MSRNDPIDPRVRLAIAQWPEDAPRGAVTSFCAEHAISRKSFYELRARARKEGPAAVLEPRSRRPHSSPTRISEQVKDEAVAVRRALETSGLDFGPISVHERMKTMGIYAPSEAALSGIFRERGVARADPRKRPRAAWRRFVYPAPNACWQLDATEYVLTRGRKCVIFQLQDDHSRLAVASLVAASENSRAAVSVFDKGVATCGVPQRLLSDNGVALNPSRRGRQGMLVAHVQALGVRAMTGKPGKPTTQGKNERFHQTLFRWLDARPIAESIEALQLLVDEFDLIYNTQRPHQALAGRITPQQAWNATPVAEPPRPKPIPEAIALPRTDPEAMRKLAASTRKDTQVRTLPKGQDLCAVGTTGTLRFRGVIYYTAHRFAGQKVLAGWDEHGIAFADLDGELICQYAWPPKGTHYVGKDAPPPHRPTEGPPVSPKS
ncbi:IS481 family transposase [Dietzia alimentaria]|uniref:IS481 family transposase n=1 Tax=Dietzia alimentaria TaxID=665550 RepID=UPI000497DCC5